MRAIAWGCVACGLLLILIAWSMAPAFTNLPIALSILAGILLAVGCMLLNTSIVGVEVEPEEGGRSRWWSGKSRKGTA